MKPFPWSDNQTLQFVNVYPEVQLSGVSKDSLWKWSDDPNLKHPMSN